MEQPTRPSRVPVFGFGDAAHGWPWLFPEPDAEVNFQFIPSLKSGPGSRLANLTMRTRSSSRAVTAAARERGLIVSFGPVNAVFVGLHLFLRPRGQTKHICWSFNFTEIPTGLKLRVYRFLLRKVDLFVVHSEFETEFYPDQLAISRAKMVVVRWGATIPSISARTTIGRESYYIAVGGEGRDYKTLAAAAWLRPDQPLVVVGRPSNFAELSFPPAAKIYANIDAAEAWGLVAGALFAVLPLKSDKTANGHVTIVGTMQLEKAQIVTASRGICDYTSSDHVVSVAAGDALALRQAIDHLTADHALRSKLAANGKRFAERHCTEANVRASAIAIIRGLVTPSVAALPQSAVAQALGQQPR